MAWLKLFAAFLSFLTPSPTGHPFAVASKAGSVWFASADGRALTIYRFDHLQPQIESRVSLPPGFPVRPDGRLTPTSVIPGDAPNFALHQWGADTAWYALAARLDGRWRFVPFDDAASVRHRYTLALGAQHHLVHGIVDSCGCASGPTTHQWFRFARDVFVATTPPGGRADCSTTALYAAGHWPRLAYDPLLTSINRPLTISRFACAAGWALATDGRLVGIYEQRSRGWLRVGIGSPRLVASRPEYAMPRSLLEHLAQRIGMSLPRLNRS
jgi:hypothetical protein